MKKLQFAALYFLISTAIILGMQAAVIPTRSSTEDHNSMPEKAMEYLTLYGYMSSMMGEHAKQSNMTKNEMAIKQFQSMVGLNITGTLDNETMVMMDAPRCGLPDMMPMAVDMMGKRRRRRYAIQGSKWHTTDLTYSIKNYTPDLGESVTKSEIRKAFEIWRTGSKSTLSFTEVAGNVKADISLQFASGMHEPDNDNKFDGEGKTLAHAFYPPLGDVHFDEAEMWTINTGIGTGTHLLQVAVHEIGHSLGLHHSSEPGSIMGMVYNRTLVDVRLHIDDIMGIQNIYGSPVAAALTMNSWCDDAKFDAIFSIGMTIYAFKGGEYVEIDEKGLRPGFPRAINLHWPQLPNDLNSAFYWYEESLMSGIDSVYFFKGELCWKYVFEQQEGQFRQVWNKTIRSAFPGVPDKIDSVFVWSRNGRLYFTKGDQYWTRCQGSQTQFCSQPLYRWHLPINTVDSAFYFLPPSGSGRTYFFSGTDYYRYDDFNLRVDKGFPMPTKLWINCSMIGYAEIMGTDRNLIVKELREGGMQFNQGGTIHLESPLDMRQHLANNSLVHNGAAPRNDTMVHDINNTVNNNYTTANNDDNTINNNETTVNKTGTTVHNTVSHHSGTAPRRIRTTPRNTRTRQHPSETTSHPGSNTSLSSSTSLGSCGCNAPPQITAAAMSITAAALLVPLMVKLARY